MKRSWRSLIFLLHLIHLKWKNDERVLYLADISTMLLRNLTSRNECSVSAFCNEQMKIGISMGVVSERRKPFLVYKKVKRSYARVCALAEISRIWLARKRNSDFSNKYTRSGRSQIRARRPKFHARAGSSETQLFMSLTAARAGEKRRWAEREFKWVVGPNCIYKGSVLPRSRFAPSHTNVIFQ